MGNNVASIVFCGASFGIVDEDDDGEQPGLQRFDAADGTSKEESEDAFLTEFTSLLQNGGLSVKKVRVFSAHLLHMPSTPTHRAVPHNAAPSAAAHPCLAVHAALSPWTHKICARTQHDGDTSKKRLLKLDQDGETLTWGVKASKASSSKHKIDKQDAPFKLRSIVKITRGAFPGKASTKKKAKRCFSIESESGNIYCIETKDSETRDILADGFELMLRKSPNRI
mmetsp:Transcript_19430/g.51009  ORF Transcript_19430/g.51009 Transcript_19430/m.51009 type:complete len:225 (+) Transcript_19430:106-780(+)